MIVILKNKENLFKISIKSLQPKEKISKCHQNQGKNRLLLLLLLKEKKLNQDKNKMEGKILLIKKKEVLF